jgi:hypothetical protein
MITGTISISDYLDAQRLHRSPGIWWYYLASAIAVAIVVALYFLSKRNLGLIVGCAGIGGVIGELTMSAFYLPWKVRRLHRQQKTLASPFTYTWDSEFLEARGISGHSKHEWKNYAKCKESEKIFLLYHADNLFEMFPKSWFRDQTQIDEFRKFAHRAGET